MKKTIIITTLLLFVFSSIYAQTRVPSGSDNWLSSAGDPANGDIDGINVFFFEIPDSVTSPIYFAVQDPGVNDADPQDQTDMVAGESMTFTLVGGEGTYSDTSARKYKYETTDVYSSGGTQLDQKVYSTANGNSNDTGWTYFNPVYPSEGEHIGNKYYFKIIAEASAGSNFKNGYRFDASFNNGSTPTGISSGEVFAYSWCVVFRSDIDDIWDFHPFVPEGAGGAGNYIIVGAWDFDPFGGEPTVTIYDKEPEGAGVSLTIDADSNDTDNASISIGSDEDNGTWRVRVSEVGSVGYPNTSELWAWENSSTVTDGEAGVTDGTEPNESTDTMYRVYASSYNPPDPDHIATSAEDGTAIDNGTDTEKITFQVVDIDGNPLPYQQNIYVDVSTITNLTIEEKNNNADVDNPITVGGTSTVVTTDVSGVGWITISRADTLDGTVTITPVTDGTNGSSDLPGTNESVDVVFDGRVPPTISSANYLLEDVGTAPVALPDITVTEGDTGNITVADDIRIRIPDSLDAVFNTGATVTTSVSGGTQGDTANGATYESGDKVAVIDVINNGFDSGRAVTISGLEFVSANSVSSGRLELSFNGGGLYPVDDDKLYTFDDLSSKKWYGTTDSDWNNAANWDPAAVPVAGDSVLIKNVTTQPVLTANTANALADLTIESGASLSLAGFTLYTSAFENQGTLIVNSGEDVSNFTLDTDSGAVEYSGGGTTIAAWTGYHDLRFSAGSWTLGSAVTVGDDLTIDAGDTLSSGNFDITVSGDWNNQGTYSSGTETVSFTDSAKSSTITGSTSFANLLVPSAAAGKTIYFQDGTTQIVTSDLSITGTSGNEILLRSTAPGTQWTIRNDTATQDISYVDVQDSNVDDASTGGDLLAAFSTDSGGNDTTPSPAWNFNPILTWTGAAAPDSDWNNAANWNPSVVPGTSSTVIIPDVANDPVLSTAVDVAELTIEDFGILDLAGSDLTVSGTFTMQPDARLILQGTEVVSGAGSLGTPIPGTVEYTGTTSSLPLGYSYTNLEKSTGGTLTLDSPLTLSGTLTVSGGTLDMNDGTGPYTATVAGDVVFSGGALSDPGEIIFDGGVVQTLTPDNQTFAALTVADTSGSTLRLTGTLTLSSLTVGSTETAVLYGAGGNVDVTVTTGVTNNGSFTMNDNAGANTLTMDAGGGSFTFTGNDIAYGGADLTIGGVDYLTNTAVPAGSVVTLNAGSTFDAVSIQGAAAQFDTAGNTLTAGGAITVGDGTNGGTLTVGSGGSISAAGQNLTVNADGTLASSGSITVTGFDSSGSVTNPAANSISAGGNVTIGGSFGTPANNSLTMTGAGTTLDAAVQIGSLTINPGAGNTVATLNNLSLNGSLDIQTGTFDTAANGPHNITLTGSWSNSGAYTSGANTVEFQPAAVETLTSGGTGDGQDFNNLTVNGGGTLQLDTNDLDVDGTLEITAGSTFNATATGRTLYVALGWTNSGTFSAGDSTVIFDTAAITAVNGDTIFATLEVSTAGKRVEFAAGSTQTADTVTFTGADGSLIELVSGTLGSTWNLTYNGTSATVEYVFIRDSDLLSTDITPVNSSNGGGNDPDATNIWNFPPVVWQGDDATTPSDWDTGANWNTGTVPSQWDDVRIPDVSPDPFPILGSNTTVADLDIAAAAASVSAAGFDLAVNGLFSNSGTLRLQGDEANVTGLGSPVPGLVEYYGTGTATVHTGLPAGSWYTNLRFDDPGGTPDIWQLGAPLDVDGYLTIAGGTLDASAGPHNVEIEGDWTNGGTYTAGGNTTVFNGAAAQALISGAASFSAVSVSGGTALSANAGVAFAAGGAVDIDGTSSFSISAAGADVGGNLTVSGAVSQGAGDELTVGGDLDLSGGGTFTSNGAQLLRFSGTTAAAVSPNNQNLGAVQVSTSGTKTVRFTGTATLTDLVIDASTTVTVGDTAAAAATLTVTNGTGDDVTVNGTLEFDAAAGAVSMRLADAAVLQNNGTVRVAADTNGVTLEGAAGGQMIYRGTDIDYDGQGITLGRIDYQTAMQLAAGESVTLSDALTADALTVADGASFDLDDQSLTVDNGALTVNGAFADTAASGTAAVSAAGNVTAGGTATWASTVPLTMTGAGTTLDAAVQIGALLIDGSGDVAIVNNALSLNGDMTINGILDSENGANGPHDITLTGSWSNSGSYVSGVNTVRFQAPSGTVTISAGGTTATEDFASVIFGDGNTALYQLTRDIDINRDLTIAANAELDANDGTARAISVGGSWTNSGAFTAGGNTVTFDDEGPGGPYTVTAGGSDFANVVLNDSGDTYQQADGVNVSSDFTITAGSWDSQGQALTVTGAGSNSGTLIGGAAGLIHFQGSLTSDGVLQIGAGSVRVSGAADFSSGEIDFIAAADRLLELQGNLTFDGSTSLTNRSDAGDEIRFTGGAAQQFASGGRSLPNVTVAKSGGSLTLTADITVEQNLTVSGGTLDMNDGGGPYTAAVAGDADFTGGATNQPGSFVFNGTAGQTVTGGGVNLGNIQVSNTAATVALVGTATVGSVTIDDGAVLSLGDGTIGADVTTTAASGTNDLLVSPDAGLGGGSLQFDAGGAAVALTMADGAELHNDSGTVLVADDTNGVTLEGAAGGQMIYRGTDIDYDGQGITLGRIDYQTAMQLAAWESVTLSDALTADALTVADGASFDLDDQSLTVDNGALTVNGAFADTAASGTAAVSVTANNTGNVSAGGTATWAATIGLTMSGSTTDINVDPLVYIGSFTVDSGVGNTVAVTGNNLHLDGDLTIASGVLDSTDSGTPRNITLTGSWSNGGSYISGANTVTFEGGTAETLDSGGTLAGQHRFENIVINKPGGGLSLTGNDLYLEGNLQVTDGTFDASGFDITFAGTIWDVQSSTTATALFTQTNPGRVTFVNGGTIEIYGNNTFYEFWYEQAGGTILFEAEGGNTIVQTITGDFHVVSPGAQITLDSTAPVGAGPPYPADYETAPVNPEQWQINIDQPGGATATITEVLVYRSYALYPITPDPSCTDGTGNYDWLFFIPIEYSWSEDSDGDGRLDRIRVRVDTSVTLSVTNPTNFTGVDAEVEGYSLHPTTPFSVGSQDYEFFINLAENNELDTDVTPRWRLTANDPDGNVGLIGVVGGAMVEFGGIAPYNDPVDRAAPAIAYTLAVAGKNEIFVHLSEYAQVHLGGAISAADFDYNGGTTSITGLTRISTDGGNGTREFLLQLSNDVSATEVFEGHTLAGNGTIELITHLDDMVDVVWPGDAGPAPGVAPDAADELLAPATDIAPASDLGLGLTGSAVIQPVYAFTDSSTIERDTSRGGIGTIDRIDYGDFDASGWLQARNFTLEAALDTTLSTVNTEDVDLVWDLSVSAPYLYNNLWLPQYDPPGSRDYLCGLVSEVNTGTVSIADTTDGDRFRTYTLDTATYPEIVDNTEFEFFFRDSNGLFYARVANSSASNWYRTVRPWEFKIRNVRRQTARVSILDNVINPHRGDKVELHYILGDSGRYLIQVFNLAGDLVDVLYKGTRAPGEYTTAWDGRNRAGDIVARGIYFVRFIGPDIDEMRKVLVVR